MKKLLLIAVIFMSLPCLAQVSPSTTTTFPQIVSGTSGSESILTEIIIVNPNRNPATVDIEFFNANGGRWNLTTEDMLTHSRRSTSFLPVPVESQGIKVIRTVTTGNLSVGHAMLRSNQPFSATSRFFFLGSDGSTITSVGVGPSEPIREFAIPVIYDRAAQLNTGIAIADASLASLALHFTLLDASGRVVRTETPPIIPGSHYSRFITEIFSTLADQNAFTGTLLVQTNRPVSAIALLTAGASWSSLPVTMLMR